MEDSDDFEVVSSYTEDDGIEDGVLVHPFPEKFPWLLLTAGVHAACEAKAKERFPSDAVDSAYAAVAMPLILDSLMAVRASKSKEPPIVLDHTAAGKVWIMPNSKGGITIMNPEDY
ncbi:MAG: hypothetical protein ACK5XN_21725 [Bacteroidota bacterium]|jgi:hypothetical protein